MKCRHCLAELELSLIDLGSSPPSNAYLTEATLKAPEKWFPLKVLVCTDCWLVQTEDYAGAEELFDADYAYFSSFSDTWLRHAEEYVEKVVSRFGLNSDAHVVEVAANDGYLLQYVKARNIPCLGIEPTKSTADAARSKGIEIVESFFGIALAGDLVSQGKQADLMTANNVLAHVPDINDFVSGFRELLKPQGVATFEFPHLIQLIDQAQFDTIYHEHFSYLSLTAVQRIFASNGLQVFDVEEIATHGGSLRVYVQINGSGMHPVTPAVNELLKREYVAGISDQNYYRGFQKRAEHIKHDLLAFLLEAKRQGKKIMAYGAAAKGNTLLNYAGVRDDLLPLVVDRNPAKQNKYMPGSRIPIVPEESIREIQPDFILVLPWNLRAEIKQQLDYIRLWGGRLVYAIPEINVE